MRYQMLAVVVLIAVGGLAVHRISGRLSGYYDLHIKDALVLQSLHSDAVWPQHGHTVIAVINPAQPSLLGEFLARANSVTEDGRARVLAVAADETVAHMTGQPVSDDQVTIIRRPSAEILGALRYCAYASRWMIIQDGVIVESGGVRDGGLAGAMAAFALQTGNRIQAASDDITRTLKALYARGELRGAGDDRGHEPTGERSFVVLANVVQSTCHLVELIREMAMIPGMSGRVTLTVPNSWSSAQTEGLAHAMQSQITVNRLSEKASREWRRLVLTHGTGFESGLLLVVRDASVESVVIGQGAIAEYLRVARTQATGH